MKNVIESMENEAVRERELKPLLKIADNYQKLVLTLHKLIDDDIKGIVIKDIMDWLVE